jgi:hypothetical protein
MPMSTLPEITACNVGAPPWVKMVSMSRPSALKKPWRTPKSTMDVSQLPFCGMATRSVSAQAGAATSIAATTATHFFIPPTPETRLYSAAAAYILPGTSTLNSRMALPPRIFRFACSERNGRS